MSKAQDYEPKKREQHWYDYWMEQGIFNSSTDDRTPYTVLLPPPNVTGVLHMGHALNHTVQDILVRKARLEGKNACWVPGTDHASIATEAKVVNLLKEQGINKHAIGREAFLSHAFDWKEKYGGIILQQIKKMGQSCDWDRTAFTMDEKRYAAVMDVFNRLYEDGLIYRGVRMINWDPEAKTALSDEEVNHVERTDPLYYVQYAIAGENESLTIATTRPETIMADTAICIHPEDERFTHLHGKKAIVPIVGREVPIILDEYVDREFGTGCLKITPAHDINDYNLGLKHKLPVIDIINDDGTLNEKAEVFVGDKIADARQKAVAKLKSDGLLVKQENIVHNVGLSERSGAVVEPKLSLQWFCKMQEMAKPALDAVMQDEVQFHPAKFKNTYRHWMENVHDWCISRQLWWGHRIPAWYLPNGEFVVARNEEDALVKAQEKNPEFTLSDLKQDEDVLDTWFSSWLWPLSVFDGIDHPDSAEINYYYPTEVVVTAPEIMFFWIARMIMAGYYYRGEKPFKHVYFTGIVRDDQGRKMSKQLGNSPDLFGLIDKHGADGVRFGVLISSPAGNDLLFNEKLCDQGSAFVHKLWNAHKLLESWKGFDKIVDDAPNELKKRNALAGELFQSKLNAAIEQVEQSYADFKISEGLQEIYRLAWNDFCSNYLEWIKPRKYTVIDRGSYEQALAFFEAVLQLLHPFMPFITEEIYQLLRDREDQASICTSSYPATQETVPLAHYTQLDKLVRDIRNYKVQHNLGLKAPIKLGVISKSTDFYKIYHDLLAHAASLASVDLVDHKMEKRNTFLSGADQLIDLSTDASLNDEQRKELEEELKRLKGFLKGIEKKLSNERFVQNAPENVVQKEQQKMQDTLDKIKAIEIELQA